MSHNKPVLIWRYFIIIIISFFVLLSIFTYWAVGTQLPKYSQLDLPEINNLINPPPRNNLIISTYNIGHAQGIKPNAWDHRDKSTTIRQLNLVTQAIIKINADILFLQEVDLNSQRTQNINQINYIKNKTKYNYHACALVWDKNYLPFPPWPISHHIGKIKAANCILSRYPLKNHTRIIFDKPKSNPFWYNWGYIDRGLQHVDIKIKNQIISLVNIHLEAWDTNSRHEQVKIINNYINKLSSPVILAGDFNTIFKPAPKLSNFIDDPKVDYRQDNSLKILFDNNIKLQKHNFKTCPNNFACYTFPSNNPDRRLDHIFLLGKNLNFLEYKIFQQAGTASDHLPVQAKIKF